MRFSSKVCRRTVTIGSIIVVLVIRAYKSPIGTTYLKTTFTSPLDFGFSNKKDTSSFDGRNNFFGDNRSNDDVVVSIATTTNNNNRTTTSSSQSSIHKNVTQYIDNNNQESDQTNTTKTVDVVTTTSRQHQQQRQRRQPEWMKAKPSGTSKHPNNKTGGFVHVGKSGGSSLSSQIRNACHSFVKKPCKVVPNETIISEIVTDYYHVPDVLKVGESNHDMYFVTARDPLDRMISAFAYLHPKNIISRDEARSGGTPIRALQKAFTCFPTLEKFAQLVGNSSTITTYDDCRVKARQSVMGNVPTMTHMWANYQKYVGPLLEKQKNANATIDLYVLRKEQLWNDWQRINTMLDPHRTVVLPSGNDAHSRNVQHVRQPVTRNLTETGRHNLCAALEDEYAVFFALLTQAKNLNETDVQEARERVRTQCPNLEIANVL